VKLNVYNVKGRDVSPHHRAARVLGGGDRPGWVWNNDGRDLKRDGRRKREEKVE
jgi:hypothetical protein